MATDERILNAIAYHRATKHHFHGFAKGPGYLDWATQPDPFRRYAGAEVVPLERDGLGEGPRYDEALVAGAVPPAACDARSLARLFFDSLAISAWKQAGPSRWALRVNPSSGNLHPTEGYLLAPGVEGLSPSAFVAHHAPREHALEIRARLPDELWRELMAGLPTGCVLVGLTSIHWREAWKYGERAWRYCQHDVGHAIAAVAIAASGLGWRARCLDDPSTMELARLLGVENPKGAEPEHPDCILAISTTGEPIATTTLPESAIRRFRELAWAGEPNALSLSHRAWPIIGAVAEQVLKPRTGDRSESPVDLVDVARASRELRLRAIVRQRRSAVAYDGATSISREAFYEVLAKTLAAPGRVPFGAVPWRPLVHLGLFVHRVDGLEPGLYVLVRDPNAGDRLRAAMSGDFEWARPDGAPGALPLFRLVAADARRAAEQVSCHQAIAGDGCFSLGMMADFEGSLARYGAWMYPRLFWETGVVGQVLYLEAEAAGIRATGIGCFFDDSVHAVFGLEGLAFQSLYHFTMGGAVEDTRLTTLPAYPE